VSDTGELGTPPHDEQDIVDRASIGTGLEPGNLTNDELQEQELEQERESWGDGTDPEPTD
jgi:hypothetical protein